jgi:hypothetical protein
MLSLVSCENFLKGSNVREELSETIEIANSKPVTIVVTVDENTGTATQTSLSLKKKQSFDIMFKPSGEWQFIKWEVRNRDTQELVPDAIKFDDEYALETKGTLVKPQERLEIHPLCILQPAVIQITPDIIEQIPSYSILRIKFNMPMPDSVTEQLAITYHGESVSSCFDKPYLNDAGDVLIISPNTVVLNNLIKKYNNGFVDISFKFNSSYTVETNGIPLTIKQDANSDFTVKFYPADDDNAPEQLDFFLSHDYTQVTQDLSTLSRLYDVFLKEGKHTSRDEFDAQGDKLVYNRCGRYIYLYGKFKDVESRVQKIGVYEQYCKNYWNADSFEERTLVKEYDVYDDYTESDETWFTTDDAGITVFCIKHYLQSEDGAIKVSVCAADASNNVSKTNDNSFVCFKKGNWYAFEPQGLNIEQSLDNNIDVLINGTEKQIETALKTIEIYSDYGDDEYFYDNEEVPPDFFTIECEYEHTGGKVEKDKFDPVYDYYWSLTLDVPQLSGLELKFIITDALGNVEEKHYKIPDSNDYILFKISDTKVAFAYKNGEKPGEILYIKEDSSHNKTIYYEDDYEMDLEEGYTYRFVPHFAAESHEWWGDMVHFYSELPPSRVYSLTGNSTVPAVLLQNFAGSERPYKIVNNKKENILDITVKIDDNSWTGNNYSDIVLFIQNTYLREVVDGITPSQLVYFNKNSTEVTFSVYTDVMFNSEPQISVYGIKDGICSPQQPVNIPRLTIDDEEYDNVFYSGEKNYLSEGFYISIDQQNYDQANPTFQFYVKDLQTGIDTEKSFIIEGKDVFEQYGKNISDELIAELREQRQIYKAVTVASDAYSAKFELPVWLGIAGYSYYIYDNGGNLVCNSRNTSNARQRIKELSKPDANSISFNWESFGQAFGYFGKLCVSKWDGTGWQEYKTIGSSTFIESGFFKNPTILKKTNDHYPADSFIKLYYYHLSGSTDTSSYYYTHPVYIYTGDSNTPNRTVIYPPVDDYVLISSDAPVLARTIVTDQPYEVCKNWTKLEWEEGRKCIKEDVITFAADDYTAKSFTMYNSEEDLKNVKCYVVIVHFADGSVARSQIIQK